MELLKPSSYSFLILKYSYAQTTQIAQIGTQKNLKIPTYTNNRAA